ncbi:MAG TPA: DEAD/DEAH box helicase [Candidatus Sulfotelmatobacter sp.]|jgi:ATP-dependent RNA helicase DeaD|nr:DEAD/DEAH box helicase [Candidatus Sulfotelmatobacter sp.]
MTDLSPADFTLAQPLAQALAERSYTDLTAVQAAVLDPRAGSRDLLVSAQTGSGKTVAYGLAMAGTLLGDALHLEPAGDPLALVVAPTRELALQVHAELTWLYAKAGGQIVSCVGGMDPRAEQRQLARGAHIVVGTPGRLRDHLERGALRTGNLKAVVLDEADEMLDLGFREDLEFILEATPQERRTLLFSATLPKDIITLAKRYQRDAWRISLASGPQGHSDIEHRVVRIAPNEIEHAVVNLLRYFESPTTMVFCNTREAVRHLQAILLERGFGVVALSGELSQNERNHALQALRDGRARVCVATDVAARGIDLPSLDLVIHAEMPRNAETMQHRSGRTGRAGRKGVSVLLVQLSRRRRAEMLLQSAGLKDVVWSGAPSADDIAKLDQERLLKHPLLTGEISEDDLVLARALLAERSPEEIAAALVRMYRAQLPAAEDVFDPGPGAPGPREPRNRDRDFHDPREFREPRAKRDNGFTNGAVWFRLNIGRLKNADPRWLIPMICRHGKITKQEIGAIRIFERETKFEINAEVAERFIASAHQIERPEVRIERLAETPTTDREHSRPQADSAPSRHKGKPNDGFSGPKAPAKAPWKKKPKNHQA